MAFNFSKIELAAPATRSNLSKPPQSQEVPPAAAHIKPRKLYFGSPPSSPLRSHS